MTTDYGPSHPHQCDLAYQEGWIWLYDRAQGWIRWMSCPSERLAPVDMFILSTGRAPTPSELARLLP